MTKRQQRFHAAVAAMQGMLANANTMAHETMGYSLAKSAIKHADALLAELDRNAPKDEPRPKADGWHRHIPGDPMPCDPDARILVKLRDGHIGEDPAYLFDFGKGAVECPEEIVAWRAVE
jgi:hypothetical protein